MVSGVTVAGDLVFVGESDSRFDAMDTRTGKLLWSFWKKTHGIGGANGSPAVYTVNGREFVVMAFGGNDHVRLSDTSPPGDAHRLCARAERRAPSDRGASAAGRDRGHPAVQNDRARASAARQRPGDRGADARFNFWPNTITARPGEKLAVHIVDVGIAPAGMAVMLPSGPVALKGMVKPHKNAYFIFRAPDPPGIYQTFSPLPGQKFFGMIGELRVSNMATTGTGRR